ncbi:chymotrypsinogen B-like [Heptranchias perlo]|uniref:chymotrypsinogen B-like n=1 Tax=Heptranchias perlo TaxID=212740 RepID=UPI00355ABA4F
MALFCLLAGLTFLGAACGCGVPIITPVVSGHARIVKGEMAVSGSWPWQTSIQDRTNWHFCGGSLINSEWVITAAQCGVRAHDHRVILGTSNRKSKSEETQVIEISMVITHPDYSRDTLNNDVALLKLASPAKLTARVLPVCLPTATDDFPPGLLCETTGWGLTNPNALLLPVKLHQAELPIVSNVDCQQYWGTVQLVTASMICTGGAAATSCLGDSGNPLVCQKNNAWYLVGIVSWGSEWCDVNTPTVYARVTKAQPWIDQTIATN